MTEQTNSTIIITSFKGLPAYNAGNNVAGSKAGQTVWTSISPSNAKNACAQRGALYHLQNIYEVGAINTLLLIELGTPDAQAILGQGNVTSGAKCQSGASNTAYRGIYEWWGNAWEIVDGLTTNGGVYNIFSNQGDGTYVNTGVSFTGRGSVSEMCEQTGTYFDLNDVFIPSAVGSGTYSDSVFVANNCMADKGGFWSRGQESGAFMLHILLGDRPNGDIGFRLAKYGTAA